MYLQNSETTKPLLSRQLALRYRLDWDHATPDSEPREHRVSVGDPLGDDAFATIDVRDLEPQRRHQALLTIFDDLAAGERVVLVNDHDPKLLYYELRSMHGEVLDWEYASRGSGEWRVEIVKTDDSEATVEDVVTRYDVREIPKQERHPTIHHRYGMIPEGEAMEIIASHDPRPLEHEFRQQYGDSFTWEVVESEPGRCRVQITKNEPSDGDTDSSANHSSEADEVGASPSAEIDVVEEFDVRDRPPAQRHERIYDAYDDLAAGEGFVFVNDHDPKPLYYQFDAEAGPEFRWEYRAKEPGEFRVLIGKSATATGTEPGDPADAPF